MRVEPWICSDCGDRIVAYSPGAFGPNGETPCAPCHNRAEAAFLPPETDPWPEHLGHEGECGYCGRSTRVRIEPFGGADACKGCFDVLIGGAA